MEDGGNGQRIKQFSDRLVNKVLNYEIATTFRSINNLEKALDSISKKLSTCLPTHIVFEFKNRHKRHYDNSFRVIKNRNLKKITNLRNLNIQNRIKTKDNWLRNLSDVAIPDDIRNFLALGFKFALPPSTKDIKAIKLLADIENIIQSCPVSRSNIYRARVTNILTNFYNNPANGDHLTFLFNKTRKFLTEHRELIITRADKGNVTVIMSKED
jgi:hypothetical protein